MGREPAAPGRAGPPRPARADVDQRARGGHAGDRLDRERHQGRLDTRRRQGDHRRTCPRRADVAPPARGAVHARRQGHRPHHAQPRADALLAARAARELRLDREPDLDDGRCQHARDHRRGSARAPPRRPRADVRGRARDRPDVPVVGRGNVPRRLESVGGTVPVHAADLSLLVAGLRRIPPAAADRARRQLRRAGAPDVSAADDRLAGGRLRRPRAVAARARARSQAGPAGFALGPRGPGGGGGAAGARRSSVS